MKTRTRSSKIAMAATLAVLVGAPSAHADTPGEDGVEVIYLLKDCTGAGKSLGTDCYQTVADLQDAIWGTSGINPTASAPLVVDIGVGDFTGELSCSNGGHVSFRGVGRDHSRIIRPGPPTFSVHATLEVIDCDDLEFQDLALINTVQAFGSFPTAVSWAGGGSSTWTDVHLEGDYAGWFDFTANGCGANPVHYFFGSLIVSGGHYGYVAGCGEHWVYGSEIRMRAKDNNMQQAPFRRGVAVGEEGDFRIFGSTIRAHPDASYTGNHDFIGVQVGVGGGGIFHMHGGIISVKAPPGRIAAGIDGQASDALAHTIGTAFALNASGGGSAIRVSGIGKLQSPHVWESGTAPPPGSPAGGSTSVISQTGKDMYVETDCDDTDCDGKSDPHLMIYHAGCTPEPWFDVVRGECRD